jgi:hypothetical protein
MKSSVKPFRPELEKLMAEARERIAAERFDPVRVKSELAAAAKEGRSSCLLRVEGPVDLQQAPATLALLTWVEREGMRASWTRRPIGDADGEAAWDLLVSWRALGTR